MCAKAAQRSPRGSTVLIAGLVLSLLPVASAHAAPERQDAAPDQDMVVRITSPLAGEQLQGSTVITGFAADRRGPAGSGLNERDIQIWLTDATGTRTLLGYAALGSTGPEAIATVGSGTQAIGFSRVWDTCTNAPGSYEVEVWVSSLARPGARNRASTDVAVAPCPGTPAPAATTAGTTGPASTAGGPAIRGACRREAGVLQCQMTARGPANTLIGSEVEITRETLVDGRVAVERWTCGPVDAGRVVDCATPVAGRLFQGARVTAAFVLADGETHLMEYNAQCNLPTPVGTAC
jgi:hypothetical protein